MGETHSEQYQALYQELAQRAAEGGGCGGGQSEGQGQGEGQGERRTLSASHLYQLRAQVLSYKHLIRNLSPAETGMRLDQSQWNAEKERLAQRCLAFFRDRLDKDQELAAILARRTKREELGEERYFMERVDYYIGKRRQEIMNLLSSDMLSREAHLRLTSELKFLSLKDFYFKLKDKLLENVYRERRNSRVFEKQLLDRSFFLRERVRRRENVSLRREEPGADRRKRLKQKDFMEEMRLHQNEFF